MAQESEVFLEDSVWLEEYRSPFIAFRMLIHFVEHFSCIFFFFFKGICLLQFLTPLVVVISNNMMPK